MAWNVDPDPLDKSDKYSWHMPLRDQQHVKDTVAPGDLSLKPSQIQLKPTKAPTRSGIQHGQDMWDFTATPSSAGWYIHGTIIEE